MRDGNRKAVAMSRKDIRKLAKMIRKKCGLENVHNVPVCQFFEWIMEKLFPDFDWEVVPDYTMTEEGVTFSESKKVEIRQDVYVAACRGDGRARFTIMHEIGHFILHGPNRVALCRLAPGEKLRSFEDPEWQADTFAAEFLMDFDLIQGLNYKQISDECGVTYGAAKTRIGKMLGRWIA